MLAVLYDIHGNLPALEAVLDDARAAGADRFVLGGDYCAEGPWPRETLERLQALPEAAWIRGNTDRMLLGDDELLDPDGWLAFAREALSRGQTEWLHGLPERLVLGSELYCHASPLSDEETFAPEPAPGDEALLAGEQLAADRVRAQPPPVPSPGALADRARQPGQCRTAARRRPPRRLGAAHPGPRNRAAAHRVRRHALDQAAA